MHYGFILPKGDARQMKTYIDGNRTATTPYDIVVEGKTPGKDRPG